MQAYQLAAFTKGWFAGDFEPTLLKTKDFEVACKYYQAGDREDKHVHRIATEITVIAAGRVRMNDWHYDAGTVIVIKPNEATDFYAVTDAITFVVKVPSMQGDKYGV